MKAWLNTIPEFSDAVDVGTMMAVFHWEKCLQRVAIKGGGPGTSTAVVFGLVNRSKGAWRSKQVVEVSGPDGGAIQIEKTTYTFNFVPRNKRVNLAAEIVDREPLLIEGMAEDAEFEREGVSQYDSRLNGRLTINNPL